MRLTGFQGGSKSPGELHKITFMGQGVPAQLLVSRTAKQTIRFIGNSSAM